MSALLANLALAAGILLIGVSALLMVIGLVAYYRLKAGKLLLVAVAFAGFLAQGILYTIEAYRDRADASVPALPLLSLGIVLVLYVAVLKR